MCNLGKLWMGMRNVFKEKQKKIALCVILSHTGIHGNDADCRNVASFTHPMMLSDDKKGDVIPALSSLCTVS